MKIRTSTILGNALIELNQNHLTPVISVDKLFNYANIISEETDMDAFVSGIDLFNIKERHRSHIKLLTDTMEFTLADNASVGDLINRYQTGMPGNILDAFKSKKSYDFLGIKTKNKKKK